MARPYLFNLFINDLNIDSNPMTLLVKFADEGTTLVIVNKSSPDISQHTVNQYLKWSEDNCMPYNVTKCNEHCTQKRSKESYRPVNDIKQVQSLKILWITFQNNSRFTVHIKNKLL